MRHGSSLPLPLPPSFLHSLLELAPPPPYLLLLLLLILLGEEGVDPPDLGEHAAIRQAEAEAEEPQAELTRREGERSERTGVRGHEVETFPFEAPSFSQGRQDETSICFHLPLSAATTVFFIYNQERHE